MNLVFTLLQTLLSPRTLFLFLTTTFIVLRPHISLLIMVTTLLLRLSVIRCNNNFPPGPENSPATRISTTAWACVVETVARQIGQHFFAGSVLLLLAQLFSRELRKCFAAMVLDDGSKFIQLIWILSLGLLCPSWILESILWLSILLVLYFYSTARATIARATASVSTWSTSTLFEFRGRQLQAPPQQGPGSQSIDDTSPPPYELQRTRSQSKRFSAVRDTNTAASSSDDTGPPPYELQRTRPHSKRSSSVKDTNADTFPTAAAPLRRSPRKRYRTELFLQ